MNLHNSVADLPIIKSTYYFKEETDVANTTSETKSRNKNKNNKG